MLNNPLHRLTEVLAVWVTAGLLVLNPLVAQARDAVRLATTTSTENTGLLRDLLPRFTADTGYSVHVIAVGTGKALRMGRDGDVDVRQDTHFGPLYLRNNVQPTEGIAP